MSNSSCIICASVFLASKLVRVVAHLISATVIQQVSTKHFITFEVKVGQKLSFVVAPGFLGIDVVCDNFHTAGAVSVKRLLK